MSLTSKLRTFLRGTKTSERLSDPELRAAISVDTGLEDHVAKYLTEGRDVVVTGSAGGGKTQLIQRVSERLASAAEPVGMLSWDDPAWADMSEPTAVRAVHDLTATNASRRRQAVERVAMARSVVVGANEGTISKVPVPPVGGVLEQLHSMQQGIDVEDQDRPVVVDLAGFNPFVSTGDQPTAFERVLGLEPLANLVAECCPDPRVCYRARAWKLLSSPEVRRRLNSLYASAYGPAEIRFREIWDFVEDLVLDGSCQASPPTSPWFWRVFSGGSKMARKLRETTSPHTLAIPGDESRLYYGDWLEVAAMPVEGHQFLWLPQAPSTAQEATRAEMMTWLKAQIALGSADSAISPRFTSGAQALIDEAIRTGSPETLIESLNRYQQYNVGTQIPRTALDLWVELMVERRQKRPPGAFALGRVSASSLTVRRSRIIGNAGMDWPGSRAFLVGPGNSALRLDERLLAALSRGRAVRTADRRDDDIDWAIWRFYVSVSTASPNPDPIVLQVVRFDGSFGSSQLRAWSISADGDQLEARVS